jgi:hypothetical protein
LMGKARREASGPVLPVGDRIDNETERFSAYACAP